MHRRDILKRASDAVMDRGASYGEPEDNFARIAARWNAHLHNIGIPEGRKVDLTPTDVAIMMADMKLARLENDDKHEDSWVDLAGYAACGAEVSTETWTPWTVRVQPEFTRDHPGFAIGDTVKLCDPSWTQQGAVVANYVLVQWEGGNEPIAYLPSRLRHSA